MRDVIVLPPSFRISDHAAQRFLERIVVKEFYSQDEKTISFEIIQNILTSRAIKQLKIDKNRVQLRYLNAVFIYDVKTAFIVTVYPDASEKEKVEWRYKFPAPLHFAGEIEPKCKVKLINEGFVPMNKDGRCIVGQAGEHTYKYDPKYNVICPL
ncbi:MAG: hypothetical protein CVU90_07110 [Firmicutes bacterium HGW-Firmicutes-15]|nr:MAG: hypothetical protein CVU90_07110 [Firmicutes bacterium HGW-Firmicutes-15]